MEGAPGFQTLRKQVLCSMTVTPTQGILEKLLILK